MCTEYVEMEPFLADCKVQGMRDGNVYITERPKQKHNTPIFREDNSTLTLGRDGKYYFCFILPEAKADILRRPRPPNPLHRPEGGTTDPSKRDSQEPRRKKRSQRPRR